MSEIASFASNIFAGLEYIHLRDMIHTDVKFGNIIIADNDTLKLIDFDRATPFVEAAQNSISNSRVRGTLEYEAPELSAGKNFDLKVDSWSVGVVLAECVLQTDYLFKRKSGENQNDSYRRTLDSSWQEILGECSLIKQDAKVKDSFFLLLQSLIVLDPSARLTSKDARTSDFLSKCTHLPIDPTKVTKYDPAVEKKFVINSQKIFDEELTQ
uniref:Protein kinase domain-containing protein n=1 Tax=Panagrolaimus superbus TaxID=310955 RepID=A0A914Y8D9_9BILA